MIGAIRCGRKGRNSVTTTHCQVSPSQTDKAQEATKRWQTKLTRRMMGGRGRLYTSDTRGHHVVLSAAYGALAKYLGAYGPKAGKRRIRNTTFLSPSISAFAFRLHEFFFSHKCSFHEFLCSFSDLRHFLIPQLSFDLDFALVSPWAPRAVQSLQT